MNKKIVRADKKVNRNKCLDDHVTSIVHQFSFAVGKSKGSKTRRQSYPQRRTSKVEDIAEDSENEEEVGLPQKSDGKYTFLELRCYRVVNNRHWRI